MVLKVIDGNGLYLKNRTKRQGTNFLSGWQQLFFNDGDIGI